MGRFVSIMKSFLLEKILQPEQFALIMCDDLDLPTHIFIPAIAGAIRQHCDQFSPDEIACDHEDRRVIIKVLSLSRSLVYQ